MGLFGNKNTNNTNTADNQDLKYLYKFDLKLSPWGVTEDAVVYKNKIIKFSEIKKITLQKSGLTKGITIETENSGFGGHFCMADGKTIDKAEEAYNYIVQFIGSDEKRAEAQIKFDFLQKLNAGEEIRRRCTVCGNVFCFNYDDYKRNEALKKEISRKQISAGLEGLAGSSIASYGAMNHVDNLKSQLKDFSRCPQCGSQNLQDLSEEDFRKAMAEKNAPAAAPVAALSPAEELKKFKELLDMGIITQEEFDAKKKQLLGL